MEIIPRVIEIVQQVVFKVMTFLNHSFHVHIQIVYQPMIFHHHSAALRIIPRLPIVWIVKHLYAKNVHWHIRKSLVLKIIDSNYFRQLSPILDQSLANLHHRPHLHRIMVSWFVLWKAESKRYFLLLFFQHVYFPHLISHHRTISPPYSVPSSLNYHWILHLRHPWISAHRRFSATNIPHAKHPIIVIYVHMHFVMIVKFIMLNSIVSHPYRILSRMLDN